MPPTPTLASTFAALHPVLQALLATLFTWFVTALGAATVFFTRKVNAWLTALMLGFAAGVMIAASFWSLLAPAIELARQLGGSAWLPAVIGFLAGGLGLFAIDKVLPHLHPGLPLNSAEGVPSSLKRSALLVLAITLHNFPEGLAVGVAFGAVASGLPGASLTAAIGLAIGIGLQNFPEGVAVAMPLRADGLSRLRSFWYGQLSALVEPVAGVIGAAAVLWMQPLLPYALSFAAGAMFFVVVEELIPESQNGNHGDVATIGALLGFAVMMWLDVALG
jgi:zinc transporter, ZIP family